jgi:hypothetical protein
MGLIPAALSKAQPRSRIRKNVAVWANNIVSIYLKQQRYECVAREYQRLPKTRADQFMDATRNATRRHDLPVPTLSGESIHVAAFARRWQNTPKLKVT